MITPVVKELKRVSPHATRLVAPSAPQRRPVIATLRPAAGGVGGAPSSRLSTHKDPSPAARA